MQIFAQRLKQLRLNKKKENPEYTQEYVAEKIGVARTTYTAYERGTKTPPPETVKLIAEFFGVSSDYLLGMEITKKAEKDIAKRLQIFREEIENSDGLAFNGEPLSEEAKESLIESMEYIFRQTQKINKKYVPKKYREEDNE